MIQIHGLNRRQRTLAAVLWALDTVDQVENFVKTLPDRDQKDCRAIMQVMVLESIDDDLQDVRQAADILNQFRLN